MGEMEPKLFDAELLGSLREGDERAKGGKRVDV
jgi:hypothetical protein